MSTPTVGIAGAGLLGRLLAWQLLERGCSVSLFEADGRSGQAAAAWTAAGMVAPLSEAVVSEPDVYQMGLFALERWNHWCQQLAPAAGLWQERGSLVVAHPQDRAELTQFYRDLNAMASGHGTQWLSPQALSELEPALAGRFGQGLWLEQEGHLDNRRLLECLLERIEQLGGHCHFRCPVTPAPGRIDTGESRQEFDRVIDCRGMGAKDRQPSLRGVRGEVLRVQTPEVRLQRPVRLMHPRYQLYVVPKPDDHFVIGATQIESEDRSPMSLQSALELGSALYSLAPAFAEARIVEQSVNLRPGFPDNRPRIERAPGWLSANGLFRHGYLLAPAVIEQLLSEVLEQPSTPFADFLTEPGQTAPEAGARDREVS